MTAGFGLLALSPQAFWSMTLRELEAAIRGRLGIAGPAAPSRSDLADLLQRYPDREGPDP
jgi:uncharacterized phage protein (TIGR02216 family)